MYSTDGEWYNPIKAMYLVNKATMNGSLVRPSTCELCGKSPIKNRRTPIHAHHWNGYNNPLDVWWLCKSCNGLLIGEQFHCGKVSKEDAREFIEAKRFGELKTRQRCAHVGQYGRCKKMVARGEFCPWHDSNRSPNICQGITKKGLPCTNRIAIFFSDRFCQLHSHQNRRVSVW